MKCEMNTSLLKSGKQGWMGEGDSAKKGSGGVMKDTLAKANDRTLIAKPNVPSGPGVDKSVWTKADDKSIYKQF